MLTTDKTLPPAKRRSAKKQQEILAAAHDLIKEKGIEGLTMRSLAEKMDYSAAALYKYYGNKEDILEGLRQQGWALLRAMNADAVQAQLASPELFKALGRAYQNFATRYPEYYLLMFTSSDAAPRSLEEIVDRPDFKRVTDLVQAGIDDGALHLPEGTNALQIRFLIWFASHGMAMLKLTWLRECGPEMEMVGQQAIDALVGLLTKQPT